MEGFTFYQEYYETLKKVKKVSDRQAILTAILEFIFEDKEPDGLSEVAEIVFEIIRKSLTKSKNNAGRGGRKNKNRIETDCKPIANRIETDFDRESPLKESPDERIPLNEKERSKEKENIYPQESYPQEINPQETVQRVRTRVGSDGRTDGQGEDKAQAEFFTLYPKISIDNYSPSDYVGIDFNLLIQRFEESSFLRTRESFSWVCSNYRKIAAGEYTDFGRGSMDSEKNMGYNGMAFFDRITEQLKEREAKGNDG